MSGLVGYGSSDEEDEIQPEKPAKVAKLDAKEDVSRTTTDGMSYLIADSSDMKTNQWQATPSQTSKPPNSHPPNVPTAAPQPTAQYPPPGPSAPPDAHHPTEDTTTLASDSTPASPYTTERQRIRDQTMPTIPNFSIPSSPPPPNPTSEEAATLATTTKKFTRFLELKKQGTHFNDRLQSSSSLRNPSLLPKLMDFAGMTQEESYQSSLPLEAGGVPIRWPEECYVENLVKVNDRREKKRMAERERVDFVPGANKSAGSSKAGTPKESGRRSRFDKG